MNEAASLLIQKAKAIAQETLKDATRSDGSPFMNHVQSVAAIVNQEIGLPPEAQVAVYLHEASRKHPELLDGIRKEFGQEILTLVTGLNRISTINPKDTRLEADIYRKLIVSYSTDPLVTLIKLADRLELIRSLDCFTKTEQVKKATETLFLYAPLAHQLGLYRLKSEMEDLSFKALQPEDYRLITNNLRATEIERKAQIAAFVKPLEEALKKAGLTYELKSRTKATYSIWRKMQAQQVGVDGIYDILAIRFIIDVPLEEEKAACWQVYSLVTHVYEPIPERMRDWITVPKASGYESLHATVRQADGMAVEVQIRSRRMDALAEYGVAAHWAYKGVRSEEVFKNWLNAVRQRLQAPQSAPGEAAGTEAAVPAGTGEPAEGLATTPFKPNEVYVFTPTGDLRRLPLGATVLDFAFDIHSNVGVRCTGGRINGKMAQLRDPVATGDVVEVLTAKNQKPSPDWLHFVVSSKAKNKIRQKLREEAGLQDAAGRELLERRLKNWKLTLDGEVLGKLLKQYKCKQQSDFYAAVADERIPLQEVKEFLENEQKVAESVPTSAPIPAQEQASPSASPEASSKAGTGDYLVIDDKLGRIGYKLAKCCNPIMGDPVFGFVSVKEGVKIHRMSCPNAARLMTQYPYRIQKVKWRQTQATASFQVGIRFTAYDEIGLTQEVGEVIKNTSLNLRQISFTNQRGKVEGRLQVAVNSNKQVDVLLSLLRKIRGMVKVVRE